MYLQVIWHLRYRVYWLIYMPKMPLPELLRTLRKRLGGLSQEQLAHRMGLAWSTINRWENGRGKPSPLARQKLDQLLDDAGLKGQASLTHN